MDLASTAAAFGRWNRRRKLEFALEFVSRYRIESVLLVGVYPDQRPETNQIERGLQAAIPSCIATGIVTGPTPAWDTYVHADARALPFRTGAFDLVYSNAVIEHVGGEHDQRRFIAEHDRVGRSWITTTPNRLFPVEAHYRTLFTHSRRGWSRGDVTRLLSRGDLARLVPSGARIIGTTLHPTLAAFRPPR